MDENIMIDPVAAVRKNRDILFMKYKKTDGLHKYFEDGRLEYEKQGWKSETFYEVYERRRSETDNIVG